MSVGGKRLDQGGAIDRQRTVEFTFDGVSYNGHQGDTLASALLANGVRLFGRSFKYHRPRGLLGIGFEEPNALVELRSGARAEPNTRATGIEIFDGMEAKSQNRFPSLAFDLLGVNQLFGRFFTAGFYYKTFMWPAGFWEPVYEKLIRRAAGLGTASRESDPDHYEHSHAHCDVLVVGTGPAGLMAALTAAQTGARVMVLEDRAWVGGMLAFEDQKIEGAPAQTWVDATLHQLQSMDNVRVMTRTTAVGVYDGNVVVGLQRVADHVAEPGLGDPRQRLWILRAKQTIFATGSIERPMLFGNNDLPGVMLASAVRGYVHRFAVTPGRAVVIVTTNDDGYNTAFALHEAGEPVVAIVDARDKSGELAKDPSTLGIKVYRGSLPVKAVGWQSVKGLVIENAQQQRTTIDCDCIAVSGGFNPDVNLYSQTGHAPVWNESIAAFVPGDHRSGSQSVGACNGDFSLADCLSAGAASGASAAAVAGFASSASGAVPSVRGEHPGTIAAVWLGRSEGKVFVDLQNDVTAQDVTLAEQEGYVSVEHTKRYTTLGMATDQGKTANVNGIAVLAAARGQAIADVGTTRYRPPTVPVAIGAFAGHERGKNFQPIRKTAFHAWHEKNGAVFVEAGQWLRARHYPLPGEDIMAALKREAKMVRESVGMCDVSTLGKIEIFGPDAAEFLNRLYINNWLKLPIGKARYGVMLREDGYVYDDGTTSRLGENHFFMTTTTANAAGVLAHMDYHSQVVWPDLDVVFCSATEQWCGFALAGPNSRTVLEKALPGVDVGDEVLPFMGVLSTEVDGMPVRIFRISFSGELAYEVNVPWGYGVAAWERFFAAGQEHGIIAYGTEALTVLRIEKGHAAGQELDGRTTAADLGMGRMASKTKSFIGQPMSQRAGMTAADRPSLVGIKVVDSSQRLRGGAHLFDRIDGVDSRGSIGWVTSVTDSPAVGCWIALAFIKGGSEQIGKRFYAHYPLKDEVVEVEVCSPHFFDPDGERLRG
jgi:sarcosine oxidase subunit alpha